MTTSKEAIERVMTQEPMLTKAGFFVPFRWSSENREATFRELREAMLNPHYVDHFERSCVWLKRSNRFSY